MAKTLAYEVLQTFNAFGTQFSGGEIYPADVAVDWPEGTLERRIANGFIKLTSVEADAPAVDAAAEEAAKKAAEEAALLKQMEEDEAKQKAAAGGN